MTPDRTDSPVKNVRWLETSAVVDVVGDIDLACSTQFQQAVLDVVSQKPAKLVINLAGVSYVDSSGVASLVKILSRARKMGMPFKLAHMNGRVRSVFEITRLDTVFDICDTEEEALSG